VQVRPVVPRAQPDACTDNVGSGACCTGEDEESLASEAGAWW
jgi:hypothetical protein